MEKYIHKKVSTYSLGMEMKLIIAMSLIQKPEVLLLDEPLNGIDTASSKIILNFINAHKSSMGIIITSHDTTLINKICDRIYKIKNNEVKELSLENNSSKVIITVENPEKAVKLIIDRNLFKKNELRLNKNKDIEIFSSEKEIPGIVKKMVKNNIDIYEISHQRYEIE